MNVYCPKCGKPDADVTLSLVDGETFECRDCGETFGLADVQRMIESVQRTWARLAKWVEACPAREAQPAVAAKAG